MEALSLVGQATSRALVLLVTLLEQGASILWYEHRGLVVAALSAYWWQRFDGHWLGPLVADLQERWQRRRAVDRYVRGAQAELAGEARLALGRVIELKRAVLQAERVLSKGGPRTDEGRALLHEAMRRFAADIRCCLDTQEEAQRG